MAYKIYVDAGHGGSDPGAVYNGYREKDLNLSTARYLTEALERCGFLVRQSRTTDVLPFGTTAASSANGRANDANSWGADIFISVHYNANSSASAHGLQVMHYAGSAKAIALAKLIASEYGKIGQELNAIYAANQYIVLNQTSMPSIILETAFMSNADDLAPFTTEEGRKRAAEAVCKAVCAHFGVAYVPEGDTPTPESESGKYYAVQLGAYKDKSNATKQLATVQAAGFADAYIILKDTVNKTYSEGV